MKLHYFKGTVAVAVAITLHEAGLDFEAVNVDFQIADQTRAPYLAINPKGRVPALDTGKAVLTETGAILDYIAAVAPRAGFVPTDALQAARMREAMYYLASTMHVNHAHKTRGARWATEQSSFDDMKAKVTETMTAATDYVETHMLAGPFVLGDTFSLADPYLFVVTCWLPGDSVDLGAYPKITAFRAAMEERASVKAVRAAGIL